MSDYNTAAALHFVAQRVAPLPVSQSESDLLTATTLPIHALRKPCHRTISAICSRNMSHNITRGQLHSHTVTQSFTCHAREPAVRQPCQRRRCPSLPSHPQAKLQRRSAVAPQLHSRGRVRPHNQAAWSHPAQPSTEMDTAQSHSESPFITQLNIMKARIDTATPTIHATPDTHRPRLVHRCP